MLSIGGEAEWANSVEDAIEILTRWGAISTCIHLEGGWNSEKGPERDNARALYPSLTLCLPSQGKESLKEARQAPYHNSGKPRQHNGFGVS